MSFGAFSGLFTYQKRLQANKYVREQLLKEERPVNVNLRCFGGTTLAKSRCALDAGGGDVVTSDFAGQSC